MFDIELDKYKIHGSFSFKVPELLSAKCNAPNDKNGVYLIYKVRNGKESLIYIGSSGQKSKDGTIKTRKSGLGGMRDRIVNGYHPKFGKIRRQKAFPIQMLNEDIEELKIYWWVTYDRDNSDFPTNVEAILRDKYSNHYNKHPDWHK
jgi:hypothetical protein